MVTTMGAEPDPRETFGGVKHCGTERYRDRAALGIEVSAEMASRRCSLNSASHLNPGEAQIPLSFFWIEPRHWIDETAQTICRRPDDAIASIHTHVKL